VPDSGPVIDMVRAIPAGHRLTREGVVGREAFVVLDGEADVFVDGELIATVGPGDVVGEVAIDAGPRSATVRARTAMRVLVVGGAFEDRVRTMKRILSNP